MTACQKEPNFINVYIKTEDFEVHEEQINYSENHFERKPKCFEIQEYGNSYWEQSSPEEINEEKQGRPIKAEAEEENVSIKEEKVSDFIDFGEDFKITTMEEKIRELECKLQKMDKKYSKLLKSMKSAKEKEAGNCEMRDPADFTDDDDGESTYYLETDNDSDYGDSDDDIIDKETCNMIVVQQSHNSSDKRIYDKSQCCIFCIVDRCEKYMYLDLRKHLFRKHTDQVEVAETLSLSVHDSKRKMKLEKIRNWGNYVHNCNVLREGKGIIIPCRCPPKFVSHLKYAPCRFCLGFFLRRELWKHAKTCNFNPEDEENKTEGSMHYDPTFLLPASLSVCQALNERVISKMKVDEVNLVIKGDGLILRYGEKLYQRLNSSPDCHILVSQTCRPVARLVLEMRKLDSNLGDLTTILDASHGDKILQGIRNVAGYDSVTGKYERPSLALKLGHILNKCTTIKEAVALEKNDSQLKLSARTFQRWMAQNFTDKISKSALCNLNEAKWNSPAIIPFTEDIVALQTYLRGEMKRYKVEVETHPTKDNWKLLSELALTFLILFNRKRTGEASKVRLNAYLTKSNRSISSDLVSALTPVERAVCEKYPRIVIRGKGRRKGPLIFPPYSIEIIDVLVKHRKTVGVNPRNEFLFAYPHEQAETHIRGRNCLKEFSKACGAKYPEALKGTGLRRHIATFSQVLNLSEYELEQLANFLGHDIGSRRNFDRLTEDLYALAKVGRLLVAMDKGKCGEFKGKSVEEIDINTDEPLLEMSECTGSESTIDERETNSTVMSEPSGSDEYFGRRKPSKTIKRKRRPSEGEQRARRQL